MNAKDLNMIMRKNTELALKGLDLLGKDDQDIVHTIVEYVCKEFKISKRELFSRRKNKPLPEARRAVAKTLRDINWSFPKIGKALGKDHTSVITMVDDEKRLRKNEQAKLRMKGVKNV